MNWINKLNNEQKSKLTQELQKNIDNLKELIKLLPKHEESRPFEDRKYAYKIGAYVNGLEALKTEIEISECDKCKDKVKKICG